MRQMLVKDVNTVLSIRKKNIAVNLSENMYIYNI